MFAYEYLGMSDEVHKKFEILYEITGNIKNHQPAVTIWTDKTLAMQLDETWKKIVLRST